MTSNLADIYAKRKKLKEAARKKESGYSKAAIENVWKAIDYVLNKPSEMVERFLVGKGNSYFSEGDTIHPPSVIGMREPENLTKEKAESLSAAARAFLDPYNATGLGLFARGVNKATDISGELSLKGNALSSADNYIDNFYGPSGEATPGAMARFMKDNQEVLKHIPKIGPKIANLENYQDSANMLERAGSFANWMEGGVENAIRQTLDPSARAMYREQGVNKQAQRMLDRKMELGTDRATHTANAQMQASGTLIPDQAGRVGNKAQAQQNLEKSNYLTDPMSITEGTYKTLIKENNLGGRYASGRAVSVSDKDLDIIDRHVQGVWKDASDTPVGASPGSHMRIKNSGAGQGITGSHFMDFRMKSGVPSALKKIISEGGVTGKQLWEGLKSQQKGKKWSLSSNSDTWEKAQENGIWLTGSFGGTAVTEGGVNFLAKVSPNGKIMAVVSDEHNFLEKMPVFGRAVSDSLPKRSISVTAPMYYDISKKSKTVKTPAPEIGVAQVKENLRELGKLKPSREALQAERMVNTGAGMLTGKAALGDEE
jgi:hypothetical protein